MRYFFSNRRLFLNNFPCFIRFSFLRLLSQFTVVFFAHFHSFSHFLKKIEFFVEIHFIYANFFLFSRQILSDFPPFSPQFKYKYNSPTRRETLIHHTQHDTKTPQTECRAYFITIFIQTIFYSITIITITFINIIINSKWNTFELLNIHTNEKCNCAKNKIKRL